MKMGKNGSVITIPSQSRSARSAQPVTCGYSAASGGMSILPTTFMPVSAESHSSPHHGQSMQIVIKNAVSENGMRCYAVRKASGPGRFAIQRYTAFVSAVQ